MSTVPAPEVTRAGRNCKVKYVLWLCEAGYNGGKVLSESVHDTFDEAMDAIPFKMEFDDARSRADIKNTLDSVGAWSIWGIGNLSFVIHTRKQDDQPRPRALYAGKDCRMPRVYYSKQKALYAFWFDNSYFLIIAPGLHDHETESHIFYSENAVKKYLEENGFHKL